MNMTIIYGLLVCMCVVISWRTFDITLQKVSMLVALDWVLGNLTFDFAGRFDPWIAPVLGAFVAVLIGSLAIRHTSRIAWIAVLTFLAQETVAVVGFATHMQGSVRYYEILNLLFVIRVMIVGGAASYVLARRASPSDHRPAYRGAHRERHF